MPIKEPISEEVAEAGLFFTLDKGNPESVYLANSEYTNLKALLEQMSFGRGNLLTIQQNILEESYTYDANSNRASKTTPWGTIDYRYDSENRLVYSGVEGHGTTYRYDAKGNLVSKQNAFVTEQYAYNSLNRMVQSMVDDHDDDDRTTSYYGYDAFGRRTLVQDSGDSLMRTLYDGQSFDILRESAVYTGTTFTASQNTDAFNTNEPTGERYRFISDQTAESYDNDPERFTGTRMPLYAKGQAVGISLYESAISTQERAYFGTDILGSVRSTTDEYATIEERYEYDAFGTPYEGDFDDGMDFGYTGKPYDETTGLYNYGYRDYDPQTARFSTVDPIRDGNNWFSYVVNDPVNYVDLWGLATEEQRDAANAAAVAVFLAMIELKTNSGNDKEINGTWSAFMHYLFGKRDDAGAWIGDKAFEKILGALPEKILDYLQEKIADPDSSGTLEDLLKGMTRVELENVIYHFGGTGIKILGIHVGKDEVLIHVELFGEDGFWDVFPGDGDQEEGGWDLPWSNRYPYIVRDGIISISREDYDALQASQNK